MATASFNSVTRITTPAVAGAAVCSFYGYWFSRARA
jgi:hypothetical protein